VGAHVTEPISFKEVTTKGHLSFVRIHRCCNEGVTTAIPAIDTRKREFLWLLFLGVGVFLGSLEFREATGNSSVSASSGSAKKRLECRVLAPIKGAEE
jgi:hypothetical protein